MKTRQPTPQAPPPPDRRSAAAAPRDHVIICGLGNLGLRIYIQLDVVGVALVVVDPDPEPRFARRVHDGHDRLLIEDARLPAVLEAAGISTATTLITTFDDDLVNLEVVLTAVRLRPELRVVMRFFNIDLAPTIQAALPTVRVLSLSALASPAFVAAATDPYARHAMYIDDQVLSIDEIPLAHTGTLERLTFGNAVVLAWQGPGAPPVLFPPPSQPVRPGDRLTVIGPEGDIRALPRLLDNMPPAPRPAAGRRPVLARGRALLRNLDRALYLTLGVLAVVIVLSVGIFARARQMAPLDALVLVFGVVSTTGIGWLNAPQDPAWLKVYVIGLMITGTAVLTVIYAFVTNYIVSVKLSGLLGQQPARLRDHIIVCGLGTVGYRVVASLVAQEEAVVLVEQNSANRFLPLVRTRGGPTHLVLGDARLHESLTLANVAAARCIVCATSDDMANLQAALNARQLNPGIRVVLRMFDAQMAQQVGETFGFDVALSASALAAPSFVAAASGQAVVQAIPLAGGDLAVARLVLPGGSPAAGQALGAILAGLTARVLYYTTAGLQPYYRPRPTAVLTAGDVLLVIAPQAALREIARRLTAASATR